MNKKVIIPIIIIIFGLVFVNLKRIPFPKQGKFLLNNDSNSNCILVVDKYNYHFEGQGTLYDDIVSMFKASGEIKKIENYNEYEDIYLITSNSNGPYISFSENDIISFSLGVSFSDHYDFYQINE